MTKDNPKQPVEKPSKDLTEQKEFIPTPAMVVWLDTAIELASDSPTEIANNCQVKRQTYYTWLKKDGFEDWYYREYKNKRRRWIPTLDKIGMKQAKRGDHNFWKDMNKKAGEDLDAKKAPQVAVQVNNITSKKSDEYGI